MYVLLEVFYKAIAINVAAVLKRRKMGYRDEEVIRWKIKNSESDGFYNL